MWKGPNGFPSRQTQSAGLPRHPAQPIKHGEVKLQRSLATNSTWHHEQVHRMFFETLIRPPPQHFISQLILLMRLRHVDGECSWEPKFETNPYVRGENNSHVSRGQGFPAGNPEMYVCEHHKTKTIYTYLCVYIWLICTYMYVCIACIIMRLTYVFYI